MDYFFNAYKRYADFNGRARRKEYWMFYLFYMITLIILSFIDGFLGAYSTESGMGLLSGIFLLVSIVPYIALTTRRLHDTNRSGWWQLIILIPIIGPIVLLVFLVLKATEGENRFGPDPLALDS
jgi:uncharacterized membrane protein YhaH (DUF805 family)